MKKLPANRRAAVFAACTAVIASSSLVLISHHDPQGGPAVNLEQFVFGLALGVAVTVAAGLAIKSLRRG
jgi:hypothetical protein